MASKCSRCGGDHPLSKCPWPRFESLPQFNQYAEPGELIQLGPRKLGQARPQRKQAAPSPTSRTT